MTGIYYKIKHEIKMTKKKEINLGFHIATAYKNISQFQTSDGTILNFDY